MPLQKVIKRLETGDVASKAYGSKLDGGRRAWCLSDVRA
jgi:hypothetical protein